MYELKFKLQDKELSGEYWYVYDYDDINGPNATEPGICISFMKKKDKFQSLVFKASDIKKMAAILSIREDTPKKENVAYGAEVEEPCPCGENCCTVES